MYGLLMMVWFEQSSLHRVVPFVAVIQTTTDMLSRFYSLDV